MSDDIIDRLRCAYSKGDEPPCEACTFCVARAEIERLRAELEQARLNLQHARTGKALLDLEREREERQLVEQSLIRTVVRLLMQNRDLRAHNERLEQRISNRRPDITIDVGVGTAMDTLRQINRHLDSIEELTLDRKDRHVETEP